MRTLGTRTRKGKKAAARHAAAHERPHPAIAKLAVALKEHKETLEQQAATAEILRIIASGPDSPTSVFEAITRAGTQLLPGTRVALFLVRDGQQHYVSHSGIADARRAKTAAYFPRPVDRTLVAGATILDKKVLHFPDLRAAEAKRYTLTVEIARKVGYRALLSVPLLRAGRAIGALTIGRVLPGPFTKQQIALVKTFADQAVIAIENARLFNETKDALERQTATADILRVISGSPTDIHPVLRAVAERAAQLCDASNVHVRLVQGELMPVVVHIGAITLPAQARTQPISKTSIAGRAILECQTMHIEDVTDPKIGEQYPDSEFLSHRGEFRTLLVVPMVREGKAIGTISVRRAHVRSFSEQHIKLLQTFADQAVIAIENVRLFNETKEALERQTATADILRVIASSPSDVQPVFEAIVQSAVQLCGARFGRVYRHDGSIVEMVANHGLSSAGLGQVQRIFPRPAADDTIVGRVILTKQPFFIKDIARDDRVPELSRQMMEAIGTRSQVTVPMLRAGEPIGAITMGWDAPEAFNDQQVALLQTFADQAVIAIENARLFNETKEAFEHQQASADILRIVSQSVADSRPAFEAILAAVRRLFAGFDATVWRVEQDRLVGVARGGPTISSTTGHSVPIKPEYAHGIAILERRPIQVDDVASSREISEASREDLLSRGRRAVLLVPFVRDEDCVGAISVSRTEPYRFSEKQVALLQAFARQAVIAIENARLFNETKEALEQQTVTADILNVISVTPTDAQPVFEAIAKSALNIFGGMHVGVGLVEGDAIEIRAGTLSYLGKGATRIPLNRETYAGRAVLDGTEFNISDVEAPGTPPLTRERARLGGWRAVALVPMLREGIPIGHISVHRDKPVALDDKQFALLRTFARQAVIAIENVRLFTELRATNATLTEALEQQTATAEVLNAISSSVADTRPVFQKILESTERLFAGRVVGINVLGEDGMIHLGAYQGAGREEFEKVFPLPVDRNSGSGLAIVERRVVHIPDTEADGVPEAARRGNRARGNRASLYAPMMSRDKAIGVIWVSRELPGPFREKEIALLKTFTDQAVIAIENARLFKELQERTEALTKSVDQLTALGEVGQAISSTLDLETVLKTIVSRAVQLTGLDAGAVYEYEELTEQFHLRTAENMSEEMVELLRRTPIRKGEGAVGGTAVARGPIQIPETHDESYRSQFREVLIRTGRRALLAVPLMREDYIIGALTVQRNTPGPFAPEVVELLKTFATQSAMAIQNARLFREIAEKGRQLEVASEHKSQFLASMSHELRTPLNALLGFNEMILGDVYGEVPADMRPPLAQMQTSGKHLLRLINNVLDLAKIEAGRMELALADYSVHDVVEGVRSTLQPLATEKGLQFLAAVPADVPLAHGDSGRIAQCLMNLAGNSLKFTKAGKVEISVAMSNGQLRYCVADTGIGIPADKVGSLFTEFRQTDATVASEYGGTGLGLSISKKFVEMHGGRIWVESEPGRGSVFTFEVPLRAQRGAAA